MKRLAALLFVLLLPGPFRAAPRRATQAECVRSDVRKAPPAERNPDARRERTPERAERYSSENWPTDDDAAVQRRLRPLHRPRVGFRIEQAAHAGDSLWIVVRIAVPHGAIRRGECFEASFLLHTDLRDPDAVGTELNRISLCGGRSAPQESSIDGQGPAAEFETRRRQVRHLYYSCKLAFDPRLEEHPFVGIVPSLAGRGCRFDYQELLLPFAWRTGPQEWKGAEGLQQQELLEHSPRSY